MMSKDERPDKDAGSDPTEKDQDDHQAPDPSSGSAEAESQPEVNETDKLREELSKVFSEDPPQQEDEEVVLLDGDAGQGVEEEMKRLVQEALDVGTDKPSKRKKERRQTEQMKALLREKAQLTRQIETFSAELYNLRTEMKRMEEENAELVEQAKRSHAELQNFRKRVERERDELLKFAAAETIEQIIPVLDNFERATASAGPDVPDSYSKGIELIYQEFMTALKKLGLAIIEGKGEQFDPNIHEAVMREKTTEFAENEIIEEFQKGYMLHDRLLRPSMVKVAYNEEREADEIEALEEAEREQQEEQQDLQDESGGDRDSSGEAEENLPEEPVEQEADSGAEGKGDQVPANQEEASDEGAEDRDPLDDTLKEFPERDI